MSRRKKRRFEHNKNADNVIERGKPLYTAIKGKWNQVFFKNNNPIILELACGKGEYSVGLGEIYKEKNFIGIDIKGDRIARGSKKALEKNLSNVCFLRAGIQFLDEFFENSEVDEIWLVHPDPQPRDKEEKKRLTNQNFLNLYAKYLKKDGLFHLKTDSDFLYDYSLGALGTNKNYEILAHTPNLYDSELYAVHHKIVTYYEAYFLNKGHKISYISTKRV